MIAAETIDTIVAITTPPGQGGVGVVRLSGAKSPKITETITRRAPGSPRLAVLSNFHDAEGAIVDTGLVIAFANPASYTGESVVEWHVHGAPIILDHLVELAVQLGARVARPGEFTERAFLNGKLDLAQAEAVADLIAANNRTAAQGAARSLQGVFSEHVNTLTDRLTGARAFIEATIDFPDEEIEFLQTEGMLTTITTLSEDITQLMAVTRQAVMLKEGLRVVLCGAPNVGKSSLLNALAGQDAAIVTDIPGTTRDVIREHVQIDGLPVLLMDTAGLRETIDTVERLGTQRTRAAMEEADLILTIVDDSERAGSIVDERPASKKIIIVHNKCDVTNSTIGRRSDSPHIEVGISAKTGDGLDALREAIVETVNYLPQEAQFMARRRHLEALDTAQEHIIASLAHLTHNIDTVLVAEELRLAQDSLGAITGRVTTEDLLGEIFSSFCIGK